MNFIFGSASGVGKCLYEIYKKNNQNVFGFDKDSSENTDMIIDLAKDFKLEDIRNILKKEKIDSITYCAGIQHGENIESVFNVNVISFIKIINNIITNLDETAVCAISSVHAVATNFSNTSYAASKAALEAAIKSYSTNPGSSYFYFLRLGATETNLLLENVNDVDKLKKSLPSGELFKPENVAKLIFDINNNHKVLFNGGAVQVDQGVLSQLSTE